MASPTAARRPAARASACALVMLALASLTVPTARAVEFNAAISPPRFELEAEPGKVIRDVIRISNLGDTPAEFLVRTADWDIDESGGLRLHGETLQPNSCRPWSRIERHRVTVAPRERRRYRFEVHVPEDAAEGECRFAVLFQQPKETADRMAMADGVSLPVVGQVAVVVYVVIGDAAPRLELEGAVATPEASGSPVALVMRNSGRAHGRPAGIVTGRMPDGSSMDFEVAPVAILPGMKRRVPLWPEETGEGAPPVTFPLTLEGSVEWRDGETDLSETVAAPPGAESESSATR